MLFFYYNRKTIFFTIFKNININIKNTIVIVIKINQTLMGCVMPKHSQSPFSQVQCRIFDEQVSNHNKNNSERAKKGESYLDQNSQKYIFDSVPQSCSIEINKKINELNKKNSLTLTQQSKQLKSERKTSKNKQKQEQNILANNDCFNPQKHSQLKSNKLQNPFVKYQGQKQLETDNSSIKNRKPNLVGSKRSKSVPKSSSTSPQQKQLTKKPKKVTIQCQRNSQLSIPSSSYLHNHDSGSPSFRKPRTREPRGKSCNLFKTFEGDYIEDQGDDDYFRRTMFKSMDGIVDKIHQK